MDYRKDIKYKSKCSWQEIYNEILDAAYNEEEDGRRITSSSGGSMGDGAWCILENLHDAEAPYISLRVSRERIELTVINCTEEKEQKLDEIFDKL